MSIKIQYNNGNGTYTYLSPDYSVSATNADTLDGYHAQYFLNEINTLKTSVSNGKATVAGAITDKGISTSASASFQTMADNIKQIAIYNDTTIIKQDPLCVCSPRSSWSRGIGFLLFSNNIEFTTVNFLITQLQSVSQDSSYSNLIITLSGSFSLSQLAQSSDNWTTFGITVSQKVYDYNGSSSSLSSSSTLDSQYMIGRYDRGSYTTAYFAFKENFGGNLSSIQCTLS